MQRLNLATQSARKRKSYLETGKNTPSKWTLVAELKKCGSSSLKKIVMHCFSGRKHLVRRIVDNSWYLSIPCTVTRTQQFQENVQLQDLSRILTETDAPYLSPFPDIPRNEPSFIIESLKKIAELKRMDAIEVANNIYKNYQDVFL